MNISPALGVDCPARAPMADSIAPAASWAVAATWVRPVGWLFAVVAGGVHALGAVIRHSMNPDGVVYLDIGDAYVRGDWGVAVNSYWSPLYSWILGLTMQLVQPQMRWEFPTVHVVNFVIFVLALICFERFWRELGRWRRATLAADDESLPEWMWLALGYSLFVYSALNLIRVWSVTPDMLVAAIVYLAAAQVVRIRMGGATWQTFVRLGAVLGIGYLAKTAMFPVAFVVLGVTFLSMSEERLRTKQLLIALLVFVMVAGPYVGALSAVKGRPTFGDTGTLNYAWHVNGVPNPHWQGEIIGSGRPIHGSKRVFELPPIYAFARPSGGTYPIAYDPTYWYEGVTPRFEWAGQIRVLAISVQQYFDLFVRQQGGILVGILALLCLRRRSASKRQFLHEFSLAVVALLALGMYALVYVEGRYIGAFLLLLWGDLLAGVRLPASEQSRRLLSWVGAAVLSLVLINIAAFTLERGGRVMVGGGLAGPVSGTATLPRPEWPGEIAAELHRLGVRSGDGVAVIGYAYDSYWARLARVQIVAEMFDWEAQPFWSGTPAFRAEVLRAFASTGASAIVAERVPPAVDPRGWHRVGASGCYIYVFAEGRAFESEPDRPAAAPTRGSVT
jgi:hypothetical protein